MRASVDTSVLLSRCAGGCVTSPQAEKVKTVYLIVTTKFMFLLDFEHKFFSCVHYCLVWLLARIWHNTIHITIQGEQYNIVR